MIVKNYVAIAYEFFPSNIFLSISVAFSSESLDHDTFGGSVSSLRRASCSKARVKHRITDSPAH